MPKKTLIVAQIFMTCMMAFCMSGIMMVISLGWGEFSVSHWLTQFLIAWPIAFVMTQIVSRIAFPLAFIVTGVKGQGGH